MTEKIKRLLECEKIEHYLIKEQIEESEELYFIKKRLDQKRSKRTHKCTLTLYRDHISDGIRMRGSAQVLIFPDMTEDEMLCKLREGYYAASFVNDAHYDLAAPTDDGGVEKSDEISLSDTAAEYARALFLHDGESSAFINSAEIFCTKKSVRITNSCGVDVGYTQYRTDGEIVVACKDGEDVEMFDYFSYEGMQSECLAQRVKKSLTEVKARSQAQRALRSGVYDIIIEGVCVREVLGYYLWKASAENIYTKYSECKIGDMMQGEGAKFPLNITASATVPYSDEGIKMKDMPLVSDGRLSMICGGVKFCSYLGIAPSGEYEKLTAELGRVSLAELKSTPHLHIVSFSDFQFDPLDGYFGGEIRLAYLYDGESTSIVTGGSVSGNIGEVRDSFEMSREGYSGYDYSGPLALKIKGVSVSGSAEK